MFQDSRKAILEFAILRRVEIKHPILNLAQMGLRRILKRRSTTEPRPAAQRIVSRRQGSRRPVRPSSALEGHHRSPKPSSLQGRAWIFETKSTNPASAQPTRAVTRAEAQPTPYLPLKAGTKPGGKTCPKLQQRLSDSIQSVYAATGSGNLWIVPSVEQGGYFYSTWALGASWRVENKARSHRISEPFGF
jgi:hypothetical protein